MYCHFRKGPPVAPLNRRKGCTFLADRESCSGVGEVASAQGQLCAILHSVRHLRVRSMSINLRD